MPVWNLAPMGRPDKVNETVEALTAVPVDDVPPALEQADAVRAPMRFAEPSESTQPIKPTRGSIATPGARVYVTTTSCASATDAASCVTTSPSVNGSPASKTAPSLFTNAPVRSGATIDRLREAVTVLVPGLLPYTSVAITGAVDPTTAEPRTAVCTVNTRRMLFESVTVAAVAVKVWSVARSVESKPPVRVATFVSYAARSIGAVWASALLAATVSESVVVVAGMLMVISKVAVSPKVTTLPEVDGVEVLISAMLSTTGAVSIEAGAPTTAKSSAYPVSTGAECHAVECASPKSLSGGICVDGVTINVHVIVHVCPSARVGTRNSRPVDISSVAAVSEHAGEHTAVELERLSVDGSRPQVLKVWPILTSEASPVDNPEWATTAVTKRVSPPATSLPLTTTGLEN